MLYLLSYAGDDRCLGRHPVDARNVIMECAQVGAELQRKILTYSEISSEVQSDPATEKDDLDDVREDVIPSYVTGVTFTVPEEDLTADHRKALEDCFPGVIIKTAALEPTRVAIDVEKPKGVKSAIFELD